MNLLIIYWSEIKMCLAITTIYNTQVKQNTGKIIQQTFEKLEINTTKKP